ncbi:gephyrin-like molybdotransferase Glp [Lysobacter korlensis]|uniref:Molybdopterin molybdenumtransferase n=1 Tax=Lysobacter korlensis TaxID=553636 RepID=A0ABV6RPW1_9GAMM
MIAFEDAVDCVLQACGRLPAERVALTEALGRVTAGEIRSPVDLPSFDNSAMDGFALCTDGHGIPAGREFAVGGEQVAGDGVRHADRGRACSIMTGARLPDGLDAIVPVEQVDVFERNADARPTRIRLAAAVAPGQHLRRAGEDIAAGALALPAGHWIGANELMLLAGLGLAQVDAVRRPRVALLSTGRELVDDPARPLQPGQIRNSSAPFLAARVPAAGGEVVLRATVPDEPARFAAALEQAAGGGAQLVLSTGAVSMGRFDFIPEVLRSLGAEILFHKVAMRPGKPLLFARLPGGALFFGLPGNPVSSVVGLRFFVEPAMRAMLGLPRERGWRLPLMHDASKKPGFRLHQKARLQLGATGRLGVELLPGQESFRTRPLIDSTVWAALPADREALAAGDIVDVFPLAHEAGVALGPQATGAASP